MRALRSRVRLVMLSVSLAAASLVCLALAPASASPREAVSEMIETSAAEDDEVPGDPARVDLQIVRGKQVIKHPGLIAETGRQVVLTMTEQGKQHAVAVLFEAVGEGAKSYRVTVDYKLEGQRVLEGSSQGAAREWVTVSGRNVKLKLKIDPDDTDKGDIDITPTDDPLEGIG